MTTTSRTKTGTVSGVTLMNVVKLSVPVPSMFEYTVTARGNGTNRLRVRFGTFFHLIWANVHDFELEPGQSQSRTVTLNHDDTGTSDGEQDVRFRLSRKALTKAIDWEINWKVTT